MPFRPLRFGVLPVAAAALFLLNSCASTQPFAPDMTAKAPRLEGYGRSAIVVTTRSPAAGQLFNDAVLQAYAFNEAEAVRTFKAALAQDPECAMCAWGVAWQLGPNINDTDRGKVPEAVKYVDYAMGHLDRATPREKALVESLALRYGHASQQRETAPLLAARCGKEPGEEGVHPLDQAYADRLRQLADAFPEDPDILSLYAEAEIIATPADRPWNPDGTPSGRMGEVADRLERLLATHPDHTGINHYMVHTLDAVPVAGRAVPAADRLARLAPASPHLLHMPAHTYIAVGRFADAERVNQQAVAADVAFASAEKAQGFSVTKDWRMHNQHFLWYAAMMNGDEKVALEAAAGLLAMVGKRDDVAAEYMRSLRLFTFERFGQWDRILAEPEPQEGKGVAKMFWNSERGIALARKGRPGDATAALANATRLAQALRERNPPGPKSRRARAMADHAEERLMAEIALGRGDLPGAIVHQKKAAEAASVLDAYEPPMMGDVARVTLGDLQARAKLWREAEASYREALAERPGHPLAERGLAQALAAQRKG